MSSESSLVWGKRHGVTLSQCVKCQHWLGGGKCKSFPDGVPLSILSNEFDHAKQYSTEKLLFTPKV
jgi:hypothetical protein